MHAYTATDQFIKIMVLSLVLLSWVGRILTVHADQLRIKINGAPTKGKKTTWMWAHILQRGNIPLLLLSAEAMDPAVSHA